MSLPQHFMDELRRRTNLSEIASRHVKLTKKGNRHVGLCPFHNEKTPSFHVRDDDGFYHCFGCGAGGDAIAFLRNIEGMEFMEAVRSLADHAGILVPQSKPQDPIEIEKRKKTGSILEESARYFQSMLLDGNNGAAEYLKTRGISREAIEIFQLGFAPQSGLAQILEKHGHSKADILNSGMVRQSEKNQDTYQMFRQRLMFPITDPQGKIIAFGGRALTPEQQPKYINSAESPIFQKKQMLYGMAIAKKAARGGKPLVVAEGYMDVIAIHQSGIAAAVAPMGTALTEEQIKLLWRIDDQPILCFDGDGAGQAAALKALIRSAPMLEPGRSLRLAMMPAGIDPDDMIKNQGIETFDGRLKNTLSWVDGLWGGVALKYNTEDATQRAAFWQEIRSTIREISNGQMRAAISDEIERRIGEMRQQKRAASPHTTTPYIKQKYAFQHAMRPLWGHDEKQRLIIALMMKNPSLIYEFSEQIAALEINNKQLENIRQTMINIAANHLDLDDDIFRHHLSRSGHAKIKAEDLLKGLEARVRFKLSEMTINDAREKMSEIIKREKNKPKIKPTMQQPKTDMVGQ